MKREIEFRGQRKDGKGWVFGYVKTWLHFTGKNYVKCTSIYSGFGEEFLVADKTAGQYTGLKDKNGVKIYEGDIVKGVGVTSYDKPVIRTVVYDNDTARFDPLQWISGPIEVIGNIHENPELI